MYIRCPTCFDFSPNPPPGQELTGDPGPDSLNDTYVETIKFSEVMPC